MGGCVAGGAQHHTILGPVLFKIINDLVGGTKCILSTFADGKNNKKSKAKKIN